MHRFKSFGVLTLTLLLVLSLTGVAMAKGGNNGNGGKSIGRGTAENTQPTEQVPGNAGHFKEDSSSLKGKANTKPVPPVIKEGNMLIPVKSIEKGLKAQVTWNEEEKIIYVNMGDDKEIQINLQDQTATINGEEVALPVNGNSEHARCVINKAYMKKLMEKANLYQEQPMIVSAEVPEFTVGATSEFTVSTAAYDDADKLVRAYFTIPEEVTSLEYYEKNDGTWHQLVGSVYGPETGFPVADATSRFRAAFDAAGPYTVTVEFKTVEDDKVLASYNIAVNVIE